MCNKLLLTAMVLWVSLVSLSCDRKPNDPVLPGDDLYPAQPRDLLITVSDQKITLTWNIDKPNTVKFYRIYRRDSLSQALSLIDTTSLRYYVDGKVENNLIYSYQVSAVNMGGFEGRRSAIVSATPNTFSISIEANADYVSRRQVTINVAAAPRTTLMMFSNDSLFTGAIWQRFELTAPWALSFGDGVKTVYAKFRDDKGNVTDATIKDSIILDTYALISEVKENSNGRILMFGDQVHFSLTASETGGQASISLFGGPRGIPLFDDGTHGDKQRDDAIYEVEYVIPQQVQVIQARVNGHFTDRVGNIAESVASTTLLTIQRAPDPVTLYPPNASGSQQNFLRLVWSAARDTFDFANYAIYRSRSPNFTPAPNLLIDRVTLMQTTFYNDLSVQPGVTYYYRLVVNDIAGLSSGPSNEVSGRTSPNLPPDPVVLYSPLLIRDGTSAVQLTWSRSTEGDFASYRIYRSNTPKVDSLSFLVSSLAEINGTLYNDEGLRAATTYYYRLYVYDQGGNATGSNVVNITTAQNLPPTPVSLALPTPLDTVSIQLTWSQNNDTDFASYRIFRTNVTPPIIDPTIQLPIAILNGNPATTMYIDRGLQPRTKYTYQVFVYDIHGLYAGSNKVEGTTR
jgi:fibronectin type 3 domain-containing protein